MLAKNKYVSSEFMDNLALVFRRAMFQNMLDHIVAVLILHKSFSMLMQFIQYRRCLLWHAVLKNALNNTAAIRMGGQGIHLQINTRYYYLDSRWI